MCIYVYILICFDCGQTIVPRHVSGKTCYQGFAEAVYRCLYMCMYVCLSMCIYVCLCMYYRCVYIRVYIREDMSPRFC